jgi:copper chaperone CopZ
MKHLVYISALFFVVSSCSTESQEETTESNESTEQVAEVVADRTLTMEIDGMVCEMGCGGSIRKDLKATGGVSGVQFDFEDERETNIATISFDKDLISVDEMIKRISELQDGQFTIGATSSESIDEVSTNETSSTSSSESSKVNVSSKNVEMPNFLDLLSGLLTH